MYVPAHFNEQRVEVLHQLIRERPLGTLVTLNAGGLNADHIPFEVDSVPAPFGMLRCHVARANPIWRDFSPNDAPAAFIDKQLAAIVGIEIALTQLIGKWKVSQNRPDMDRKGVVEGLNEREDPDSSDIARWVEEKLQS